MSRKRTGALAAAAVLLIAAAVLGRPAWRALEAHRARHRAVSTLEHLLAQQKQFKARLDEFLTVGPAGAALGDTTTATTSWSAAPCPSDCRRLAIEACSSFGCLDFAPPSPVQHRYGCRAQRSGDAYDVTCAAAADLDGDGDLSLLVVGTSTAGFLHAPVPELDARVALGRCADIDAVPADVVYDCTPGEL